MNVLTIGGAMIDTIAVIDDELIERMSMNNADRAFLLLEEGRKTEAQIISTHAGGGAINAAVSFARLGFKVGALVKLGTDARAAAIRDTLTAEGVCHSLIVQTSKAGTGASVLISAHERNAAVFTFRGANSLLEKADIPGTLDQNIVYITGLSDGSAKLFPHIVDVAAKSGAFITANPGIRQLAARRLDFQNALSKISLLSLNRDEAAELLPPLLDYLPKPSRRYAANGQAEPPDLMRRGFAASGFQMSLPHFCEALLSFGPKCVIITDSGRGAYAAVGNEIIYSPAMPSAVVGTAGAGDAFTSTFTAMYANGTPPGRSLQYAAANASSVVSVADTQSGLLTKSALESAVAAGVKKVPLRSWQTS